MDKKYIDEELEYLISLNKDEVKMYISNTYHNNDYNYDRIKGFVDDPNFNEGKAILTFLSQEGLHQQRIEYHYEDNKWNEKYFDDYYIKDE